MFKFKYHAIIKAFQIAGIYLFACPCCRGGARLLQRLHGRTLHRVLHRRGWLLGLRHRPLDEVVHAGEAVACDAEV